MPCFHLTKSRNVLLLLGLLGAPFLSVQAEEGELSGERIYRAQCARCHGPQGEGTKENRIALAGDLSVVQLAEVIGETMPEDDPGSLSAGEAREVAEYIHGAFYSAIARARNRPARIRASRLTVRQYRRSLADLIGSFRKPARWGDERGVKGEYYEGRRISRRRGRAGTRVDGQINFDFGTEAPLEEIDNPRRFSIRWSGSLLAPETGRYEFVVRTEHAARLWINDDDEEKPLIDAWVKSGDDTEHKAGLFLVAGHVYPLRLEFSKAKQGVDDSDKQKEKPPSPPASISLLWQRPHGVTEPVHSRNLSPDSASEVFVCETPFPPDDRSYGWVRGISVSRAWEEATTGGAIETAGYVALHLNELAGTRDGADDRDKKLRSFCRAFAERAFRQPLSKEQAEFFIDRQFAAAADVETAVKRVVLLVLKSPRFLFHELHERPDPYHVAERLALGLWDSIPDGELLKAAAEGRLETQQQVAQQAERMLGDLRAETKLREFLLTWLTADRERDLSKDPEKIPGFSEAVIADLRTSLELFLDDVLRSEEADYRRLLLAGEMFVNKRLAEFYGVKTEAGDGFMKVSLDSGKRAGVLTHPYVMASFAHTSESSPIHRGVFLARGVLGQSLRPPPEAVAPLSPELHPDLTTRERVALQTKATTCMRCHGIINPLGFTLEHYDAAGRYREEDRDKPVDATGSYRTRSGEKVSLSGARELAGFVVESEEAHAAFIEQLFHHLVQQPVRAYGPTKLDELRESFASHDFNIRKLAVDVMVASAFAKRDTEVASSEITSEEPSE